MVWLDLRLLWMHQGRTRAFDMRARRASGTHLRCGPLRTHPGDLGTERSRRVPCGVVAGIVAGNHWPSCSRTRVGSASRRHRTLSLILSLEIFERPPRDRAGDGSELHGKYAQPDEDDHIGPRREALLDEAKPDHGNQRTCECDEGVPAQGWERATTAERVEADAGIDYHQEDRACKHKL